MEVNELPARGQGPPFIRPSPRMLRNRLSDVLAYEAARTFNSTAEEIVAAQAPVAQLAPPAPLNTASKAKKNSPETV